MREVGNNGIAVAKGYAMSDEDRMRAHLIEKLMCNYAIDTGDLTKIFGDIARPVEIELQDLHAHDEEGFIIKNESHYSISKEGRPYIRSIAATFDTFFASGKARHSSAV